MVLPGAAELVSPGLNEAGDAMEMGELKTGPQMLASSTLTVYVLGPRPPNTPVPFTTAPGFKV